MVGIGIAIDIAIDIDIDIACALTLGGNPAVAGLPRQLSGSSSDSEVLECGP